jgi:hypothetical protein
MIISSVVLAQSPKPQKINYSTLNQKICPNQKGFQLVLKSISTDSRCPEGVTCMWEGEVSGVVSVYKDSKLIENRIMVFSLKNEKENKEWFSKYLPEKQRNIKSIGVLPYPKEGHTINPEAYYLKIGYLK